MYGGSLGEYGKDTFIQESYFSDELVTKATEIKGENVEATKQVDYDIIINNIKEKQKILTQRFPPPAQNVRLLMNWWERILRNLLGYYKLCFVGRITKNGSGQSN